MKQDLFDHKHAFKNKNAVAILITLTHFNPMFHFNTPLKHQHWAKMG